MSAAMWMPERLKVWQVLFLLFPLMIWLSWTSYQDFTHLEEEGGVLYVHRFAKLLYDIGGKWAVVGFPIFVMGAWGYAIYKTLVLSKKVDELRERAENPSPTAPISAPAPTPTPAPLPRAELVSKPPPAFARPKSPSGPLTPLEASAPPPPARADDVPPDPSGPKLLR
jgi:hypothetical protein